MAMKRAEKKALMRSDNPDAQAVARVTGEMFDLRVTMQEKAEEAGVAQYVGPGRMGAWDVWAVWAMAAGVARDQVWVWVWVCKRVECSSNATLRQTKIDINGVPPRPVCSFSSLPSR